MHFQITLLSNFNAAVNRFPIMKSFLFFLLIIPCFLTASAQDTVVKRNGEIILAKVVEVSSSDIKFNRTDSPNGPLYILNKWELNYIIYSGGRKESFESIQPPPPPLVILPKPEDLNMSYSGKRYYFKDRLIREPDMLAIATKRKDPKVDLMIQKVKDKKLIEHSALIGGAGLWVAGSYVYLTNLGRRGRRGSPVNNASTTTARQNGEYMMLGALACGVISISFHIDRTRHAHMVVDLYNKTLIH
jgi:hypothetical protein